MIDRNSTLEKQGKIVENSGGEVGARMLVVVVGELGEDVALGHESSRNENDQAGAGVEDVDDENDSPEVHFIFPFLRFGRNPLFFTLIV